jgi:phage replication O-like protein O
MDPFIEAQIKEGFAPIPNKLLDVISMAKLNGSQFRIVLAVIRHTYGWGRKSHEMSVSNLAKATGLPKRQVRKEIERLIRGKVLIEYKEPTKTSCREMGLNYCYSEWCIFASGSDMPEVYLHPSPEVYLHPSSEVQLVLSGEEQLHPQERQLKNNIKDITKDSVTADSENKTPYQKIVHLYHEICISFPKVRTISEERKKHIGARYKQYGCNIEIFRELFTKAENSDFLKGINDREWKADFDWLMNEANMAKVLEGKYDYSVRASPVKRETKTEAVDRIFKEMEVNANG